MAESFVQTNGIQFVLDGKPFYVNGWNSYWLMVQSIDDSTRPRVSSVLQLGAGLGLTVCRTWAFNDGGYQALQISPGNYDESVFKGLDFAIAEAGRNGVRLLLSLVNNWDNYGGKDQYVAWAREAGVDVGSTDDVFFINPTVRGFYKAHVTAVLTRVNTISGVQYCDDPTIFGWELINEPRCTADPSGDSIQAWIEEMAACVKALDNKHLLTVGLEGFYQENSRGRSQFNANSYSATVGTDFVRNHQAPCIDFATVHAYPDSWKADAEFSDQMQFLDKWVSAHIEDATDVLNQPVLFTEFGISSKTAGFDPAQRDVVYNIFYDSIYLSAQAGGAGAGALLWQFLDKAIADWDDGNAIFPSDDSSTVQLIAAQSTRLGSLFNSMFSDGELKGEPVKHHHHLSKILRCFNPFR